MTAELDFKYLTKEERMWDKEDALIQLCLGLESCTVKQEAIEILQEAYNLGKLHLQASHVAELEKLRTLCDESKQLAKESLQKSYDILLEQKIKGYKKGIEEAFSIINKQKQEIATLKTRLYDMRDSIISKYATIATLKEEIKRLKQ